MSAATTATVDFGVCTLWNPVGVPGRIGLRRFTVFKTATTGAKQALALRRVSARGTAGATVTPTIVDDFDRALAPPSGALFDLALYSVQPTYEALSLDAVWLNDSVGTAFSWYFDPVLWISPGAGVGVATITASIFGVSRCTVEWVE